MNAQYLRRACRHVICLGLGSFLFVSAAAAQTSSGINGKVTDSTAGALPGVTVTITSPALQVPSMTTVTDADGTYRFIQLPSGTYEARYELSGFRQSVRAEILLAVGFIATINTSLELGGIQETITVSGASPVVDTTNNVVTSRLSAEAMASIPNGRRPNDIAMMTPGMMLTTMPVATSLGQGSFGNSVSSGGLTNYRIATDGVEHNSGGTRSPDLANVQEINVTQSGGTADIAQAGTYVNVVGKSGGNEFHGRYAGIATGNKLEGHNIDDALRKQGLSSVNSTSYFYDINADLGGRIIRDRLWFYTSIRDRRNRVGLPGFVLDAGPDGIYGTADEPPYLPTATNRISTLKLSYQPSSNYHLTGFYQREVDVDNGTFTLAGVTRFTPYEASGRLLYSPSVSKIELNGTPRSNLLFTGMIGRDYSEPSYFEQPGREAIPAAIDLATSIRTGRYYPLDKRKRSKLATRADVTYLPTGSGLGGKHELKVGMRTWSAFVDTSHFNSPGGNYLLLFDTLAGVRRQPSQLRTYNSPVTPHSVSRAYSAYVTDRVTVGSRLTLNLGFRWDRYHAWVPAQTKVQGPFGDAGDFAFIEAGKWNMPAPRAGFAYNMSADGKTVVKGTYGWFNDDMAENFSEKYNRNSDVITNYRWHDNNRNNLYEPGEVNLATNGPDFLSATGAANNLVNLDLKYQHVHELTGSFERELAAGTGLRFLYTYRRYADQNATINALRPYSAFNIPLSRRDPGSDGLLNTSDDGPMVTVWDFAPAFAGAAFVGNKLVNVPAGRTDNFHGFEATLNKRFSEKWEATTSGSATKNHKHVGSAATPQSPNDEYYGIDGTTDWTYRTIVTYVLPLDIRVASLAFFQSGSSGQRTYVFQAADPLGGPALRQQANVTLRLDPYGTQRGPIRKAVNVRLSKIVRFASRRTLELNADINNIVNSNAAWASQYVSGPTFGNASNVYAPRLFQFGAAFEF